MPRPILFLILSLGVCGITSCVSIDGGSVEASWVVRSPDGRAISDCGCSDPEIKRVRLVLVGDSPESIRGTRPCDGKATCEFPCQRQTGATHFDIPAGRYAIGIVPLDATGKDLSVAGGGARPVRVPAPLVRDVVFGQPTQLAALLIAADCAGACAGANENAVCRRP